MVAQGISKFHGVYTALITPFEGPNALESQIDWATFDQVLRYQIKGGVQGLVPCGTTGESPTLSHEEKLKLIQYTVKRAIETSRDLGVERPLIIAGTGSNNTQETIAHTREACGLGVDAVLVVVPYYNKPSQAGLEAHFKAVADASSVPVFLYNVPGRTGISLTAATVARLAEHPRIAGIKEASGNLATLTEMRREVRAHTSKDFIYLTGDDPTLVPFLASGGHGVISVASNVLPAATVKIWRQSISRGAQRDGADELPLFEEVFSFFNALFIEANPVPCKTVLAWGKLIPTALVRLPLVAMSKENEIRLKQIWEKLPTAIREELKK